MSRDRAMQTVKSGLGIVGALALAAGPATAQERVYVNGERVSQSQFIQELGRYGLPLTAPVPDGHYWYDRLSGLWGVRGGPTMGQLPPGLNLGGVLQADASVAESPVFINGRALHPVEIVYLQQLFGYVIPGRYWLNASGIGGVEGGPPMFNLMAAAQAAAAQAGGGAGYTQRGLFGGTGSDGNCSYYMHPSGASVMTGAC